MKKLIKHIKKVELDKNKRYLIFLDGKVFSRKFALSLNDALKESGFKALVGVAPSLKGIKIIEDNG